MISKKIGPITVWVKICSSSPPPSVGAPSIRMRLRAQPVEVLAVARQALVDLLVVGVRDRLERHALGLERLDRLVDVVRAQRDVLDALAVIGREIFLDLRLVVGAFVDRDADLAAGAGHRLGLEAGQLAFDVEVADLAEIEEPFVEVRPLVHAAAMHVVGQVIDIGEPHALRVAIDARQILEVDVVDRAALAIAVDEIEQQIADALDRGDVELHRPDLALDAPGAERQRPLVGEGRVLHAQRNGADAGSVHACEPLGEALRLGVDDEVHIALAIERDILRAMPRDLGEAHALEQRAQRRGSGAVYSTNSKPSVPMGLISSISRTLRSPMLAMMTSRD